MEKSEAFQKNEILMCMWGRQMPVRSTMCLGWSEKCPGGWLNACAVGKCLGGWLNAWAVGNVPGRLAKCMYGRQCA